MAAQHLSVVIFLSIFVGQASFSVSNSGERWAVLVAGSQGWSNYRHQANVCKAYQILRKGGLKEENIIVFMYDDIAYNVKNPKQGKVFQEKHGNNVYQGVPKDYTGRYVTSQNFYNVLYGLRTINDNNKDMKVLKSGLNDHVFIYFTGHGVKNALEMPRKGDRVHRDDFLSVLNYMHRAELYKQMVVYVDACYSGSMFEDARGLDNMNIFITTSAIASESSYGCFWSDRWSTYLSTLYSDAWMKDSKKNNLRKTTFNQQYERVKKMVAKDRDWGSKVMKYGSERIGEKRVSEFFQKA